ncbi:MAG: AMP-binding protein, partial [Gemmatimonadetes bacterium]|nr:AMP-binding protein [Gemmatimonadota bacterium]
MIDDTTTALKEASGLTLGTILRLQADRRPDTPFLIYGDRTWSFRRLETESTSLAASLAGLGVEPGDRIAIDLPNWPEFVVALFAAGMLGATVVPLN